MIAAVPAPAQPLTALILAGGSGTRFWPLSRRRRPKQLLALDGERSLLQDTVDRLQPLVPAASVWIVTTAALRAAVAAQLPEVPESQILAEPTGRNTAAAIGWALLTLPLSLRQGTVVVLPADHRVGDSTAFRNSLAIASAAVDEHNLVMTLGVVPRWAETGYGYLRQGKLLDEATGLRRVAKFVEKPDAKKARRYLRSGRYLWNAGIFLFRGATLLRHLRRLQPELWAGLEAIAAAPEQTAELYPALPAISIDYAVMEKIRGLATLPLDCAWSDLGSWDALYDVRPRDAADNASAGPVTAVDARGNLLLADSGTIAVLGVDNLVVVRTADTVLVLPRERAQEVRKLLEEMSAQGREELL